MASEIVIRGNGERLLTAAQFQRLADIPPELEWLANIRNPRTRKAYKQDIADFSRFVGIERLEEFRTVTRAHVIAWRDDLERRQAAPATLRRKLSALSSLFDSLCEKNAVTHNPVDGVKLPPPATTRVRRLPSMTCRHGRCSRHPKGSPLKLSVTGRSLRCCFITASVVMNYVGSRCRIISGGTGSCIFA
jgi:hypothetical protein